jgi:hypothetical protein
MDKEKLAGLKDRLKHIDMDFDQFINYKMEAIAAN